MGHVHVHALTRVCIHEHAHLHACIHIYTCAHVQMHALVHVHMCKHVHTYTHRYTCMYMCVYFHARSYMHTHYTDMYKHMHTLTCTSSHELAHMHLHVHTCTTPVHAHAHTPTHADMYMHTYSHIYTGAHAHMHRHALTHTCTHTLACTHAELCSPAADAHTVPGAPGAGARALQQPLLLCGFRLRGHLQGQYARRGGEGGGQPLPRHPCQRRPGPVPACLWEGLRLGLGLGLRRVVRSCCGDETRRRSHLSPTQPRAAAAREIPGAKAAPGPCHGRGYLGLRDPVWPPCHHLGLGERDLCRGPGAGDTGHSLALGWHKPGRSQSRCQQGLSPHPFSQLPLLPWGPHGGRREGGATGPMAFAASSSAVLPPACGAALACRGLCGGPAAPAWL